MILYRLIIIIIDIAQWLRVEFGNKRKLEIVLMLSMSVINILSFLPPTMWALAAAYKFAVRNHVFVIKMQIS